jgi:hypothetical protein
VIKKVIILSRKEHEATVKVLEAIRGVKSGEVLTLEVVSSNQARSIEKPNLNHQIFISSLVVGSPVADMATECDSQAHGAAKYVSIQSRTCGQRERQSKVDKYFFENHKEINFMLRTMSHVLLTNV